VIFPFFIDWTLLLLIPALIVSFWAQHRVHASFRQFSSVLSFRGIPAETVCQKLLAANHISNVSVLPSPGKLSDHYSPIKKEIRLSEPVYGNTSVSAIAVAAHESGHAVQDAKKYIPLKLRNFLAPVVSFGSSLAFPLILIGIIFGFTQLTSIALIVFLAIFVFQLITLPVEFNASRRALTFLKQSHIL